MNLREFIQSEIKSQLDETVTEAYEVITKDNKKVYISDKDYKRLNTGKDVVGYSYSPEGHTETWVMANYVKSAKPSNDKLAKVVDKYAKFESVNEGKMPKKYIGNDDIVYLKTKEDSRGAHYNLYYKGHDIDAGGRRFGSEKELKDFAKDYILSTSIV